MTRFTSPCLASKTCYAQLAGQVWICSVLFKTKQNKKSSEAFLKLNSYWSVPLLGIEAGDWTLHCVFIINNLLIGTEVFRPLNKPEGLWWSIFVFAEDQNKYLIQRITDWVILFFLCLQYQILSSHSTQVMEKSKLFVRCPAGIQTKDKISFQQWNWQVKQSYCLKMNMHTHTPLTAPQLWNIICICRFQLVTRGQ